jgi:3-oxoacyl-[acyl-carrier protein] reductase
MRLNNRVALLTAAAGAGIGQATARAMAKEGAHVIITDAHEERAIDVAEDIKKQYSIETLGHRCDVTDKADVERVVHDALEKFGHIDILVNNAGTNRPSQVVDMTDDMWDLVINTSLRGTFYCSRAVMPAMMKQDYGRIVTITSVAGFMGLKAGHAHYAAAKAGAMAFTRCLAMEAAPYHITANTIARHLVNAMAPAFAAA